MDATINVELYPWSNPNVSQMKPPSWGTNSATKLEVASCNDDATNDALGSTETATPNNGEPGIAPAKNHIQLAIMNSAGRDDPESSPVSDVGTNGYIIAAPKTMMAAPRDIPKLAM